MSKMKAKIEQKETQEEYRQVEIYALKHPVSGEIRYIGKANDSQKRLKSHLRDSSRRDTPVYRWIRKLATEGLSPCIEVLEVCGKGAWQEVEIAAIAKYKAGNRLLNVALGGDEPFCSQEQRSENGRNTARAIHDNPKSKRIWELKQAVGVNLMFFKKRGMAEVYNNVVAKLKIAAAKNPSIFGEYAALTEMQW